jgi:hypothetical protein
VSVSPSTSEPLAGTTEVEAPVRLRLVPPHEHAWRLLTVEYDEGLEVRCYECSDCRDVQFR